MDSLKLAGAAGTIDITPPMPVTLGGFVGRHGKTHDVADRLEANILWLHAGNARILVITLDSLYPGKPLRAALLEQMKLKEEELFLAASHTHWAPMMAPSMPGLGDVNPDYITFVATRLAGLAHDLETQCVPLSASYHAAPASHAMNRRLIRLRLTRKGLRREAGMGPNPEGEKDDEVRLLQLSADGRPLAILWNYSCHPTGYPIPDRICAEYPGVVRQALRERVGNIPVLFFLGFAGDVRPPFHGMEKINLETLAMRLLLGPQFRTPTLAEWRNWAQAIAISALKAMDNLGDIPFAGLTARRVAIPEDALGSGERGEQTLTWHIVDCGGFAMAGINAEPVAAYRRLLCPFFGKRPFFTVGYLDQTQSYLPVDEMLAEGGYEVEGFRAPFGYQMRFKPGVRTGVLTALNKSLEASDRNILSTEIS